MAEWEAFESRLKDLGADAARMIDEPLDPASVRRLGDRRRLRRAVAAVLLAVAVLVSGGVGVYAVTAQPQRHTPSPVGNPTSDATPSPEPSEELSGYGQRIPTAPSGPRRQPVPPRYTTSSPYDRDPTPESTPSQTPTPSPSDTTEEPETPEPTSTATDDPEPAPTSEPTDGGGATQPAPPPGEASTAGG